MASAFRTTDHQTIRDWVEARGGCPAHVKRTGSGVDPGILRIDYSGFSGEETLEPLDWDSWFAPKIVSFREQSGRIESADDLMKIDGIDGATVENLRRQL